MCGWRGVELNKTGCQRSVLLFVCNECVDKCLQRADCTSCSSGMVINYVGFVFTGLTSGVTEFDIWHTVVCASTTGWLGGFPVTISSPRLLYNDIRSEVPAPAKHSAQYGFGDMCANNDGKHNIFDQFAKFVFFCHPTIGAETLRTLSLHTQQRICGSHVAGRRIQNGKKVSKTD